MKQRISCVHFVREIRAELGGVVKAALDLCQAMAQCGHRVVLFTCDATDAPREWLQSSDDSPRVIELRPSKFSRRLLGRAALDQFRAIADDVNVAHLHTPWEMINLQLARVLRAAGVPYIVSVHGMLDDYSMRQKGLKKQAYLALAGRRLFERASGVHFTAQAEMDQALAYIPGADRSIVAPCAMDLEPYLTLPGPEPALRAFPQIRRDARKILFLSRVHPKKGVDQLIKSAAVLRTQAIPFQLLIAGPGDQSYIDELKTLADSLGVGDATHFLGMVQGVEKRSLYQAADVFVLPTHQENFGLVLPEAMACGAPVVTTRGADIWRELEEGGARIVDNQPEKIAAGIEGFLSNPEPARRAGQRGREYVLNWLDRDRVSAEYEAMYCETIARGIPPFASTARRPQGETVVAG